MLVQLEFSSGTLSIMILRLRYLDQQAFFSLSPLGLSANLANHSVKVIFFKASYCLADAINMRPGPSIWKLTSTRTRSKSVILHCAEELITRLGLPLL